MFEKVLDFFTEWLFVFPYEVCSTSKYKVVRVIGILLCLPYCFITVFPLVVLYLFFAFCSLLEEC